MVWSTGFIEQQESVEAGQDFILDSLQTLKPGGVAVHVMELVLERDGGEDHLGGLPINSQKVGTGSQENVGPLLWRYQDIQRAKDQICKLGKDRDSSFIYFL
jgi:hypothetical protein